MSATQTETVLITGASSGIGLELAKCFAADGCRLILVARSTDALETLAKELRQTHGIDARVLTADLSLPETPKRIFSELKNAGVAVDVLVNNAGFGSHGLFAELSLARQIEMLQVNITALTELTGLFLPGMIQRKCGGILNVGSVAGFQPGPGMAVYFATKAFVLSFTEALAAELSDTGITVSGLCPGSTATNFGKVARGGAQRQFKVSVMPAKTVAQEGHDRYRRKKVLTVPGLGNKFIIQLLRVMPRMLVRKVVKLFNTRTFVESTATKPD